MRHLESTLGFHFEFGWWTQIRWNSCALIHQMSWCITCAPVHHCYRGSTRPLDVESQTASKSRPTGEVGGWCQRLCSFRPFGPFLFSLRAFLSIFHTFLCLPWSWTFSDEIFFWSVLCCFLPFALIALSARDFRPWTMFGSRTMRRDLGTRVLVLGIGLVESQGPVSFSISVSLEAVSWHFRFRRHIFTASLVFWRLFAFPAGLINSWECS